jgi:F0F1-type ATP synthase alpha subunit
LQIKPDEITSILKSRIEGLDESSADLTEVGTVLSVADGIARVHGLENCQALEMLELPTDVTGLALSLESDNVGAVLFGEWVHIVEGDTVKRTGKQLEIPSARACSAASSTRSATRSTARATSRRPRRGPPSSRPRRGPAPAGEGAAADRA